MKYNTENTKILRFKYDGEKVMIEFVVDNLGNDTPDVFKLVTNDAPLQSFTDALDALKVPSCEICEIPTTQANMLLITGVDLAWRDQMYFAMINIEKTLHGSLAPLKLKTPKLPQQAKYLSLPDSAVMAINSLITESLMFLNGERAQMDLFENKPLMESVQNLKDLGVTAIKVNTATGEIVD